MSISTTQNRMRDGGDTWIVGGTLKRDGAIPGDDDAALTVFLPVKYRVTPLTNSATAVHAAIALTDAPQTVTTAITNPDVPRTVTAKGNASGIAGNVVITGTNIEDEVITDTIALSGASEVEGVKAFKTVTSIALPVETNAGTDTVSIGWAKKFGLPHIVDNAALLLVKLFDAAVDAGTLAVDSDEVEKNLFSLAGTPNGSKVLDLFYLK
jgi:hypothetical protein